MSPEFRTAMLAQADQEMAELANGVQGMVDTFKEIVAEGNTRQEAVATVISGVLAVGDIVKAASLLAVAVAQLADRELLDAAKVLGRSVSCTYGCHGGNNDFDCPDHGGVRGIGGAK